VKFRAASLDFKNPGCKSFFDVTFESFSFSITWPYVENCARLIESPRRGSSCDILYAQKLEQKRRSVSFQVRAKSAQEQINLGDPSKRGFHQLDAALAAEPRCESGFPPCPARLKGEARELYDFFREQLAASGLDKRPDGPALERACVNLALVWQADHALAREGPVLRVPVMTGRGFARKKVGFRQVKNKWLAVRVEAEKMFRAFASEFGLTGPSSRVRLGVDHSIGDADRELWRLLTKPRPPGEDDHEVLGGSPDNKTALSSDERASGSVVS
jgi:phage terminase small subunit